jgi:phospholipase C
VDRREFLRLGAMAAAAAALAQCSDGSSKDRASTTTTTTRSRPRPESVLDGAPGDSGIDTVVIVMMENRSFDSYLGWLARDEQYLERGKSRYGDSFAVNGNSFQTFRAPDGREVETFRRVTSGGAQPWRGCGHPDPNHQWDGGRVERDHGFLAADTGNDEFALSFFEGVDLPVYEQLARRFTVCDRWHASLLSSTYPNREYLLSGQSGGHKDNYLPFDEGGFQWPTIMDRLAAADVSLVEYYSDFPQILLWGNRMGPFTRTIDAFATDAAAGKLPRVSILTPRFLGEERNDDHPFGDPRAAQQFVRDAFSTFARSKHWEHGLFVLTYDEWGGFFDHVPPPILPDLRSSPNDAENFGQAGFRVPTVLASPYAPAGYVDHTLYDHTSILRFLEWRFLGAPAHGPGRAGDKWFLTPRDRNANNLGATLVRTNPDPEVGFDVDVPIDAPEPPCAAETSYATLEPSAMEVALHSGYYDKIGVKLQLV